MLQNSKWGTVCDDDWGDVDATVVCQEFGFNKGVAKAGAHFGQGTGRIWLDAVNCVGPETKLQECSVDLDTTNCNHAEDAGVECTCKY